MEHTILFSNKAINQLNDVSISIRPGMMVFYQYHPKYYDESMNDKSKLWMGITNIYTLFYDCGAYLFRRMGGNLIDLFLKHQYMTKKDKRDVLKFILGIGEMRSYFCHNKIKDFNDVSKKWQGSGISYVETIMDPDALRNKDNKPNYKLICESLKKKTEEVYGVISSAINQVKSEKNNEVIDNWLNIQASWLIETDDIRRNCIRSWYNITYMEVYNTFTINWRLMDGFMQECEAFILENNNKTEIVTAISSGEKTILGVYQYIYDKHKKEIVRIMRGL